jgi:cytochrome c biogenesis protein CcdA
VIDAPLALAFGAGMVATVNPCGFAMLPAYLGYFLGLDDPSRDAGGGVRRALAVGLAVSAGFLVVFAMIGAAIQGFSLAIDEHLPWFTMVIGVMLVVLGIAMLAGFEPTIALPKLDKGGEGVQLWSMFLFGVSYAVASLSCTMPLFLINVVGTFTSENLLSGIAVFLAYAAGMAVVLMALTLTMALARQSLVHHLRRALPYIHRISGALLVLAGGYLVYYGWYELQLYSDSGSAPGGPAEWVFEWNSDISNWIDRMGAVRLGLGLAAAILAVWIVANAWRAPRRRRG